MSDSVTSRRPLVTVLSGFLGAGKTTLLRHVLAQSEGRRWAAVVNDVAAINVDAQLIEGAGAQRVVDLGNGCVCCSVRDELAETIAELASTGDFERVFVETTGVAEPRAVADLFVRKNGFGRSLNDFAQLEALVTVVDARNFLHERAVAKKNPGSTGAAKKPVFELMLDQVECADVIVINKCDLVTADELQGLEKILSALNARAEIVRTELGQVACESLLGRQRFEAGATLGAAKWIRVLTGKREAPGGAEIAGGAGILRGGGAPPPSSARSRHEEKFGITSFVFEARRALVRDKFYAWLETGLPPGLLRAKGFFWLTEQPADIGFLSVAGGSARHEFIGTWAVSLRERGVIGDAEVPATSRAKWVEPNGDRRQELVFIGTGLDEDTLRTALNECLL